MSVNNVTLIGHLTQDIDIRTGQTGSIVGRLSIAVNDRIKNKEGEWVDYANYFNAVIFGKRAESLQPYLLKGKKIGISGSLRQNRWEDKDGKKRNSVDIYINEIELCSSPVKDENAVDPNNQPFIDPAHMSDVQGEQPQPPLIDADSSFYDDDIPF
jgi:single-strand DNA-binding protein